MDASTHSVCMARGLESYSRPVYHDVAVAHVREMRGGRRGTPSSDYATQSHWHVVDNHVKLCADRYTGAENGTGC